MENKLPFEKINSTVIVKKEADTDQSLGCIPEKRSVEELIKFLDVLQKTLGSCFVHNLSKAP